ncbi:uncharacterized protein [Paramormyrops kingsleyae]|uniref:uncharacterized protein isoform X2 n=1 Tax=Paramormyrops kingsleyae TaxID=1676925 RepID=UPI003B9740FE
MLPCAGPQPEVLEESWDETHFTKPTPGKARCNICSRLQEEDEWLILLHEVAHWRELPEIQDDPALNSLVTQSWDLLQDVRPQTEERVMAEANTTRNPAFQCPVREEDTGVGSGSRPPCPLARPFGPWLWLGGCLRVLRLGVGGLRRVPPWFRGAGPRSRLRLRGQKQCSEIETHQTRQHFSSLQLSNFERKQQWIAAISRKNLQPSKYSWIFSEHFIKGQKSDDPLSPDYVPSVFVHTKSPVKK